MTALSTVRPVPSSCKVPPLRVSGPMPSGPLASVPLLTVLSAPICSTPLFRLVPPEYVLLGMFMFTWPSASIVNDVGPAAADRAAAGQGVGRR